MTARTDRIEVQTELVVHSHAGRPDSGEHKRSPEKRKTEKKPRQRLIYTVLYYFSIHIFVLRYALGNL